MRTTFRLSAMASEMFKMMSPAPIKMTPMTMGEIPAEVVSMMISAPMPMRCFGARGSKQETEECTCDGDCSHYLTPLLWN
jgi:hypothetical protein